MMKEEVIKQMQQSQRKDPFIVAIECMLSLESLMTRQSIIVGLKDLRQIWNI